MVYDSYESLVADRFPEGLHMNQTLSALERAEPGVSFLVAIGLQAGDAILLSVSDPDNSLVLQPREIEQLWGLFPVQARERSMTTTVVTDTPLWVTKHEHGQSWFTRIAERALAHDTYLLGSNELVRDDQSGRLSAKLRLHRQPDADSYSPATVRVAQAQTIVRELAQQMLLPDLVEKQIILNLPSRGPVRSVDFLLDFYRATYRHSPISHVASTYRRYPEDFDQDLLLTAISEELSDTIAAYLLGFSVPSPVHENEPTVSFAPFKDREELYDMTRDYLYASRVSTPRQTE